MEEMKAENNYGLRKWRNITKLNCFNIKLIFCCGKSRVTQHCEKLWAEQTCIDKTYILVCSIKSTLVQNPTLRQGLYGSGSTTITVKAFPHTLLYKEKKKNKETQSTILHIYQPICFI